jgi:hypothetical protein
MTEAEWRTATDPQAMLVELWRRSRGWRAWLRGFFGDRGERRRLERRARLFACACCRRIEPLLCDAKLTNAVEVAERYADGTATAAELEAARETAKESPWGAAARAATRTAWVDPWEAAAQAAMHAVAAVEWAAEGDWRAASAALRLEQCALLHDLFDDVFHPPSPLYPGWLPAETLEEAWLIYQKRRFEDLPRLAQQLAAVGCDRAPLLEHLRGPGPHARGCWALDQVLGRGG